MELNPNLKKDLPASLQDEISKLVTQDESVHISLPGSFGEALVVTSRRVIIVREKVSSLGRDNGIENFAYPLSEISSVEVTKSNTGGIFILLGTNMPKEIENHAVFFPSYDQGAFEEAKGAVLFVLSKEQPVQSTAPSSETASTLPDGGRHCGKCGAGVREGALFCSTCGNNVGNPCEVCGTAVPRDAAYCSGCGTAVVPDDGKCHGCGRILPSSHMSFCPWCGQKQGSTCYACGAKVSRTWVYCANCGRELGSEKMDAGALRGMYSRRSSQAPVVAQTDEIIPPVTEPATSGAVSKEKSVSEIASEHNERGKALFEQDSVEEAIEAFRKAAELDPSNPVYHCNLAVAYDDNDQDDEALAEYERTLELNPNDTTALLYVGYMYSENDQPEEAAKMWQRLIDVAPGTAEAEEALGNLRHQGEL